VPQLYLRRDSLEAFIEKLYIAGGNTQKPTVQKKIHPDRRTDSQQTLSTFVAENCYLAHGVTVHSLQIAIHLDKKYWRCS